jgi:hypothetical protein
VYAADPVDSGADGIADGSPNPKGWIGAGSSAQSPDERRLESSIVIPEEPFRGFLLMGYVWYGLFASLINH